MDEIIDCGPEELAFLEERLELDPPKSLKELAMWVAIQKAKHSYGMLTTEQITKLEALPGWVWDLKRQR